MKDSDQCVAEQSKCKEYLKSNGDEKSLAEMGLEDWIIEELLILEENSCVTEK